MNKSRKGIAVPVVLLIVLCVMVMTISVVHFRKQSKQQNVSNFHFLRVNFLAQSAVQHMMLKLSVFPQEAYDSGVLGLGYCPFRGIIYDENGNVPQPGNIDSNGLIEFAKDCNTDALPWHKDLVNRVKNLSIDNKYHVESLNVISAYNNIDEKKTYLTAQIVAIGEGKMEKGNAGFRKEKLDKIIQLTGAN
ncbi:MAG: hypothetical protein II567_04830 [Candidatus Riflebacteria bacterium]|nr:hypothetical protein [Candidatus Riflebacteria bacterium]